MKNKQIAFWWANFKYIFGTFPTYRKLVKNYNQKDFEKYTNEYINNIFKAIDINYSIKGQENLIDEPALYIFNHNSMFDSYFSYPILHNHSYFIAGEFTFSDKIPIVKNYMKWANAIFVNRESLRSGLKSIKQGTEELQKGNNLVIFAEGELTHLVRENNTQLVAPMHAGSFKPAKKAKVPVIPVAIKGSAKIHNSSSIFGTIHGGNVEVIIGKPIYDFKNLNISTQKMAEKTREEIVKLIKT